MVCEYYHDLLIDLPEHPAHVDSDKMRKIHLYEIEEELWMGWKIVGLPEWAIGQGVNWRTFMRDWGNI